MSMGRTLDELNKAEVIKISYMEMYLAMANAVMDLTKAINKLSDLRNGPNPNRSRDVDNNTGDGVSSSYNGPFNISMEQQEWVTFICEKCGVLVHSDYLKAHYENHRSLDKIEE